MTARKYLTEAELNQLIKAARKGRANLGSGAYSIPRSVEHLSFRTDARHVALL